MTPRVPILVLGLALGLSVGARPAFGQTTSLRLLDGTTALVGADAQDDLAESPVTAGEVTFVALLLAARATAAGRPAPLEAFALRAHRAAVLVRLLSAKSRLLGEKASAREKGLVEAAVQRVLGGPQAVGELLVRLGRSRADHLAWLEDYVLAKAQLGYVIEREVESAEGGAASLRARSALQAFVEAELDSGALRVLP